jgi:hypothetical protein
MQLPILYFENEHLNFSVCFLTKVVEQYMCFQLCLLLKYQNVSPEVYISISIMGKFLTVGGSQKNSEPLLKGTVTFIKPFNTYFTIFINLGQGWANYYLWAGCLQLVNFT